MKMKIHNKCQGWWGQYQFCKLPELRFSISRDISAMVGEYDYKLNKIKGSVGDLERARIEGIAPF